METVIRKQSWKLAVFLVATAIAWGLVASGQDGWIPFLAWVGSMAAACFVFRGGEKPTNFSHPDWMALVFVTLLAAFFRLYQLDTIPTGLWIDEIWTAENSKTLYGNRLFAPFGTMPLTPNGPSGTKQCNLYLYFAGLVQAAFGFGRFGIKMFSVLPGILAVPALYVLSRTILPRTVSLATAILLAVSVWHVTLSRWGWDEVLSTTLFILVFTLAHSGIEFRSPRSLLLAGLLSGLSLYTYLASRLGVAAVLAVLCVHLLLKRGWLQMRLFSSYLLGLVLAGFPVLVTWFRDPEFFTGRISRVSILPSVLRGDWSVLTGNILDHLLMFHFSGDMNPRHNLPGDPMFDVLTGITFAVGIVIVLCTIKRLESQICLFWFSFGLLGGILTRPAESPQGYRTGLVIPVCCLLAGIALGALDGLLRRKIHSGGRVSAAAIILLLAVSATTNFTKCFIERPACRSAWYASQGGVAQLISDQVTERIDKGFEIYIDNKFRDCSLEFELDLHFRGDPTKKAEQRVHWVKLRKRPLDLSFLDNSQERAILFVWPRNFKKIRSYVPAVRQEKLENPFGDTLAVMLTVRP